MARVAVAKTSLPAASVDGADAAVTLTTCDDVNDHVVADAAAGDLVCTWATSTVGMETSLQAYANAYGRPLTPAAALTDAGTPSFAGHLVVYYLADLDGLVNATGGFEFNVDRTYRCFCIKGGGKG